MNVGTATPRPSKAGKHKSIHSENAHAGLSAAGCSGPFSGITNVQFREKEEDFWEKYSS